MSKTGHPGDCHKSVVGHASQCEAAQPSTRAEINIPIPWSVTATDEGLSMSQPVLATNNPSFCRVQVISPAKTSRNLNFLQAVFIKWSTRDRK